MHISKTKWIYWLAVVVAVAVVIGYSLPAMAQQEQTTEQLTPEQQAAMKAAEEKSFEEEITVTGTLIPRPTVEAMSPVAVVEPEEITYSGVTRLEDLVAQMPQVFAAQNSTISNGASGTATVALRHMGSVRTLVLINGRRTVPGDPWSIAPDLNFIPAALVKRVDILTGGASTVYGADAVAGVVNFILDTTFTGVRGAVQYSGYSHNNNNKLAQQINLDRGFDVPSGNTFDGEAYDINVALGSKFADGKGHATAYVDYRHIDELLKGDRDYTNCAVSSLGDNGPECGGSSTSPRGRFITFDSDWNFVGDWVLNLPSEGGDGHSFRPRTGEVFNYAPFNHLQRPDIRWSAGAFADYEINKHFDVYTEIMFMDDFSNAQIAPTGNFGVTESINCDNPMLSEQQRDIICTQAGYGPTDEANFLVLRRNIEGPGRNNALRHTSWRLLAGVKGDINDYWSYDFYGMHAEVLTPQEYENDFSITRLNEALHVVGDPNNPSTWECSSGNPDCVPWNPFVPGGVTQDALDYIYVNPILVGGVKTEMINGTLSGDLEGWGLKFPSASEGIQVALGGEYRVESLYVHPDETQQSGDIAGFGGATVRVDGEYKVQEGFIEALIPFVQDTPGFRDLSAELGYRYSDYDTSGGHSSYKTQVTWAPTDSWKIRAGFNRATRAANVRELFAPQRNGLGGSEDICAGPNPTATLEECQRTGVTPAQYGNVLPNPASQYNTLGGGNPLLEPEVADTYTMGLVWTPQSIAGLSLTLDYYNIEVTKTIGNLAFNDIVRTCANTGDPTLCSLIHRGPSGSLWLNPREFVETTNQNIGKLNGEGVDVNFAYLVDIGGAGYLNTSLMGTYMITDKFENPLIAYDCVGYYGNQCGIPDAKWVHRARVSWETNFKWVFTLGWRYIDGVTIDDASPDPDLANPGLIDLWKVNGSYKNPSFNYIDLATTFNFAKNFQWVLGINNVFDKEPPLASGVDPNDFGPGLYGFYDPWGRYVHTSIQFNF